MAEGGSRYNTGDRRHDGSFGQKLPPLYIYLKRVLDKYPEGGQILKELVQNADDAKARNVVFLYDKSEHPRQRLWSNALADFQGPALFAYNDASFTPEDWDNIQHPDQSGKRKDPTKIGRFGLGFISVFHLTDMPCILSGSQIGYLDPLEEHFTFDPYTNTRYVGERGKKWTLSAELLRDFPDQFSPFLSELFSCNEATFENGTFAGTVFRFPLRKKPSKLSSSVFQDEHRVQELFDSFQIDSELSLLFLKNVESIAAYEKCQSQEHPRLVFKVHIRPEDRQQVHLNMQTFLTKVPERQDFHILTCLHIESQLGPQATQNVSSFMLLNALKNNNIPGVLKALIDDEELRFLPWMGMSFRMQSTSKKSTEERHGRVFCFLPLPDSETSGLPVSVHGYFGLSDNRRSIKWPDQESQHDKKAQWNKLLITEMLPDVYAQLLLAAIRKSQEQPECMPPRDVYKGWPCKKDVKTEWLEGVRKFIRSLRDQAIFLTDQGSWVKSTDVYINARNDDLISKVLMQKEWPVARLPDHVLESLDWADVLYRPVTPAILRNCVRGDLLQFLTRDEKLQLLEYVTSDCTTDLGGLYLLPLASGKFASFSRNSSTVFIATEYNPSALIPNGEGRFAAHDMPAVLKNSPSQSCTQLKTLDITDVAPLVLEMLPDQWSNFSGNDILPWSPGFNQHPPSEWLAIIWEWLASNHIQQPLTDFRNMPLIPMPGDRMARLRENGLIFKMQQSTPDPACLSEDVCWFLETVGAVVVRHKLPSCVAHHPDLNGFVKAPTPKGVMTILETMSRKHSIQHICDAVESMSAGAKDELRGLLAQPQWGPTYHQREILRQLPLFVASSEDYVSPESCEAAVQSDYFGLPIPSLRDGAKYILLRNISDNLALTLDVRNLSIEQLLAQNVLPAVADKFYSSEASVKIMTWVLERPQFDNLVREVEFIPKATAPRQLSRPKDLFEPTTTLQVLFRDQDVFPTGAYAERTQLTFLKRVGLKNQSDVTVVDILDVADQLSETQDTGQADYERGKALLEHINHNPHVLLESVARNHTDGPLHTFLENLCWVPCEDSPPPDYPISAGWKGNSTTLYSPKCVGMIESALLYGSVLPLVFLQNTREDILRAFGWSKNPNPNDLRDIELVVRHLKNIANSFQSSQELYSFTRSVSLIYKFLGGASDTDLDEIFEVYMNGSQPWIWHGSGFTTPDKIALSSGNLGVSLVPYLHIVPKDMQKHRALLSSRGVQKTFQEKELNTVLHCVQQKNQTKQIPSKEDYQTDLNLVCNILRYIVDLVDFNTQTSRILVPCRMVKGERRIKMVSAPECLYVDEERLAHQLYDEETQEEFDKPVIHESVSNDLAQRLGLLPLSHFLAPVDEVEYDMAGPHETTVNAIKRNLDMYKNDVDIFKELIQNADDAGATEVKFLLDWRRNEQTAYNLLGDGMKACHGPALWAYNDARFSKDDIKNICSIAAQSKKHQLDKVGRFGLGFTSVYHLTDVPSVVSGPYVLICDPRTIHLGSRVKPGQPGIKLDLTNDRHRRTLKSYPNQFQPYNGIFGCDLKASTKGYDHTLFRLPLRTAFGADSQNPNQLSDFICDSRESVFPLIKSLKESSATLLLFTQNVVKVSLQEMWENDTELDNIISVTVCRVQQMPRSISVTASEESDVAVERNLLRATSVCMNDPASPLPETTMILKITQKFGRRGENGETAETIKDWKFITSSCMAKGKISDLAKTHEGQKAAVLPCGGIAAQLVESDKGSLKLEPVKGSAFSYLPLNVLTDLPFHVNGNFLLQPNRRQLWGKSSSGTEEFEVRWNCCFMESVLRDSLLNLLQDLQTLQEQNIIDARNFQSLWPKRKACDSNFHPLVDSFYQCIGRENSAPAVIFNEGRWLTVHDCFFTDWTATDSESLKCSVTALLAKNQHPKRWVELETDVINSIFEAGANKCFDKNTFSVERFLRKVFFPALVNGEQIEPENIKEIILHVLDLRLPGRNVTMYDEELKKTKCVPASPNGDKLLSPNQLVNPCTSIATLYSEEDCRFPHGTEFRLPARLVSLTQLGMASDDLSWEDICERAESMLNGDQTGGRSAVLLKLISGKLKNSDQPSSVQKQRILMANILPVLKKPCDYPVKWFSCDDEFMSADGLYAYCRKDLLGSVQPLLDDERLGPEALSPRIKDFLGIHAKEIKVTDVIQQLTVLMSSEIVPQTSSVVSGMYAFLQRTLCDVNSGLQFGSPRVTVREKHRAIFDKLCTLGFVLCGGSFRECKQLAFDYSARSGPYLFGVPLELREFRNLLKLCGVRENFEVKDYLQTLELLKAKYGDSPLQEPDLKTAKEMISEIVSKSKYDPEETKNSLKDVNIFIPDNCSILRTPSELTFNDVDWEGNWGSSIYTHPDISYNHAKVFHIITQRERQLATCSSSSGFEMDFGQYEELTDRLSGILRSYPNVSDVFKELLQNADDAGATEIHFVYDPRSHQSKKVVSDSWAPVQQLPSLCVYNDRPFTEADIKGIQKVGVGGKRDDIATTGKFGIGFNAVYHLTDCPSFLSNSDTLCVFDPLLRYVQGTQKTSPGRRFSTSDEFRELYPDMLSGYLEDIETFFGKKGTVFRFPLRKEASAISSKVYSPLAMYKLLGDFQKVSQDAVLFLNNINTITISHVDEKTGHLRQRYNINAKLADEDYQGRMKLVDHLKLFKELPCQEIEPMSCVYSVATKDSTGTMKSWLISQMLGFKDLDINMQELSSAASLKKPLPRGGVAALMNGSNKEETGGAGYKAYCFLPLPIYTELPVHVNGTFELDAARKSLQKGDAYAGVLESSKDGLIHRWNRLLVQHVIAPAYAELIKHAGRNMLGEVKAKKSYKEQLIPYDNIFPKNLEVLRGEWRLLAEATLRYIGKNELEVLPVVRLSGKISWHHPSSDTSLAFFDGLDEGDSSVSEKAEMSNQSGTSALLRPFLLNVGFNLLVSSSELCRAFQACNVQAKFVSPGAVVRHLLSESVIAPDLPAPLTKTAYKNFKTLSAVLEYCLGGVTKPLELRSLPLQLANDDTLSQFTAEDGLYLTRHWKVLPTLGGMFLHKDLVTLCTGWFEKNGISNEAFTSGLFKRFTIVELGRYLEEQLPQEWRWCNLHVEWKPKKKGHPSETWLKDLWRFICSETTEEKPQQSLRPIENWPIFPTTAGKLVPPTKSKTILSLHTLGTGTLGFGLKLAGVLRKLGLPEIAKERMCHGNTIRPPEELTVILEEYLTLPKSHGDVANVIRFMSETCLPVGNLEPAECDTLLHYFQEGLSDKTLSTQNIQTIKMLPIFKLRGVNKIIDIQLPRRYHTFEGYMLMEEANIWMENMNCVFLEVHPTLTLIYKELGISPITHADIYLKYILPSFDLFTEKARIRHVVHIRDQILNMYQTLREDRDAIINRLTHIPFIRDQSNTLKPASHFYDPRNPVFKAMVDPETLLPELPELMTPQMRDFLEELGLHTVVNPNDFIVFARKIETRARRITDKNQLRELWDNAKLLKNELDSNSSLHDQSTLRIIGTIKFIPSVPVKSELLDICPAYSESNVLFQGSEAFIAFHGSVASQYMELVWSVCNVLPNWALPVAGDRHIENKAPGVTVHSCLGIVSEERGIMEKVLSHTKLICQCMEKKNAIHKEDTLSKELRVQATRVMQNILGHLAKCLYGYRGNIRQALLNAPICPVEDGRVFVRADQLVLDLGDDDESALKPYVFKAPRKFGVFDDIFVLLGAQKKCSFDQLARVLSDVENDCDRGQLKLNPNQQKTVACAVRGIFILLRDQKDKCQISVSKLYLPTTDDMLKEAPQLYYADHDDLQQMVSTGSRKFMLPPKKCGFRCRNEIVLFSYLPEGLRPKFLKDELQEKPCHTNKDCKEGQKCRYLAKIKEMVNSEEMTEVLLRLYQHQLKEKELCEEDVKRIEVLQSFNQICCQEKLKVGFYDNNSRKVADQRFSRKAFLDSSTSTLYLEHTWPLRQRISQIYSEIAECCNHLLGGLLNDKHVAILQSALDCQSPCEMNEVLSLRRIPHYNEELMGLPSQSHQSGSIIPRDLRTLLNDDPFNRFEKGEIVGYKRTLDETPQEDRSTTRRKGKRTTSLAAFTEEETEVVYAEIVDQVGKSDEGSILSKRYKIEIGKQEHIVVSVTTLFKFLNVKEADDGGSLAKTLPEDPQRDREQIEREVKEAMALPREERNGVMHRLYRKWHPDKNPGQEERTTEAFKFLKQEIDRYDSKKQYSRHYTKWESEVNRDREEARWYQQMYNQSRRRRRNRASNRYVPPSFSKEIPDPRSARLWFRQAREHLTSAEQTSQLQSTPQQWIAFQVHQAAEVALKAAQYNLTGRPNSHSNNLSELSSTVCRHRYVTSNELIQLTDELEQLDCLFNNPRYPESLSSKTSGQVYQGFSKEKALTLCTRLLSLVQSIIGIKEF
ncbi:sacsin-like [Acanthaster planci]|uniref:Sacsin-like n=1 Tax=Acanthaster planci TaxID=133434 RepID=A0A8B7YD71_ACAPL|nr:sacsin-like [Acanthaster planci]